MNAVEQFAELRDRLATDLAACIAPELQAMGAVDIAIITESDLSRICTGLNGFFAHNLRDLYADELNHRQQAETGPAIVVCDVSTAKDYARPAAAVAKLIGTAIHETIHAILSPVPFAPLQDKPRRREYKRIFEHEPPVVHVLDRDEPEFPIGGHDADFARLTIHLAARMRARGWEVIDDRLWHPSVTALSYGRAYAHALQDELESAAELPLTAILRLPPPGEFVELYEMNRRRATERPDMSFLAKLKQKRQAAAETAAERYRRFAVAVADGKPPHEDELLDTLRTLGKSLDDFETRVAYITERRELKAKADQAADVRQQMQAVEAEFSERQSRIRELQEEFNQAAAQYQAGVAALQTELSACQSAQNKLRQTAPTELLTRMDALGRELAEARERRDGMQQRLNEVSRYNVGVAERELERHKNDRDPYFRNRAEQSLAAAQREVADRENTVSELDAKIRTLTTERAEAERQLLEVD